MSGLSPGRSRPAPARPPARTSSYPRRAPPRPARRRRSPVQTRAGLRALRSRPRRVTETGPALADTVVPGVPLPSGTIMADGPSSSRGRIAQLVQRVAGDRADVPTSLADLRTSETAKAVGLAAAMIGNNIIALGSTVVFARLLKNGQGGGYGSLAALVSYFLILSVVGQALQVATAREGVLGRLGSGAGLVATIRRWTVSLLTFTVVLAVISVLLRQQIADLVGVKHVPWAAALGLPAAGLWLELSVLRGALQGIGDYKGVGLSLIGERGARLVAGAILVVAGAGVTGAYAATPVSFIVMGGYCAWRLKQPVRRLEGEPVDALTASQPPPAA